jgi:hypothetical protein
MGCGAPAVELDGLWAVEALSAERAGRRQRSLVLGISFSKWLSYLSIYLV